MRLFATIWIVMISLTGQWVATSTALGDIVAPSNVAATSQFGLGLEIQNVTNGSGLDGVGPIEDQLHDNDPNHMWIAGCADAGVPGGTPEGECADPFGVAPVTEQIIEFELDTAYELNAALVWQYNELNPNAGPFPMRGVKRLEVHVSPSLLDAFTMIGSYELEIAEVDPEPATFSEPAQTLALDGDPVARRVQFHILEAHSGAESEFVGLSEVRFDGTPIDGPLDPRVARVLAPETYTDSTTPIEVQLDIILDPGTGPFTINLSEQLPPGWSAASISNGGTVDGATIAWTVVADAGLTSHHLPIGTGG